PRRAFEYRKRCCQTQPFPELGTKASAITCFKKPLCALERAPGIGQASSPCDFGRSFRREVAPKDFDRPARIGHVFRRTHMSARVGVLMDAIKRQGFRLVPYGVRRCDAHPHLPIFATSQATIKAAKLLVDCAPNRDRGRHDALLAR